MKAAGGIKRAYERDGYAIVPCVFSRDECRAILGALDQIRTDVPSTDVLRVADLSVKQRVDVTVREAGAAIFIVGALPDHGKILAEFVADQRIVRLVGAVLAGKAGSVRVSYHYSNLSAKPARVGPRINWHRDFPNRYISMHRSRFCRAMVCLDGMTVANGPTEFQRGTHTISDARARKQVGRRYLRQRHRGRVAACPPGSVVLIHPKVRHASGPNRSAHPRRNVIVQWGVAGHTLVATGREKCTGLTPQVVRCNTV